MIKATLVLAGSIVTLSPVMLSSQAVSRPAAARKASTEPVLTAKRYRKEVSQIGSCADYRNVAFGMLDPLPLIESAAVNGALKNKTEYESSEAAAHRINTSVNELIGDSGRVSLTIPLKSHARYNADSELMEVDLHPTSTTQFPALVGLRSKKITTGSYVGKTIFGGSRRVRTERFESVIGELRFKPDELPNKLVIPMGPEKAYLFKEALGILYVLGRIDYVTTYNGRHAPTVDDPVDRMSTLRTIVLTPRCAFVTNATETVEDWTYDNW